jgi:hypothetical protein
LVDTGEAKFLCRAWQDDISIVCPAFEAELAPLFRILRPGEVVIDVGAHVGKYSVLLSRRVGPTGRVLAVEANPETFAALEQNLRLNRRSNVQAVHGAAWNADGTMGLFLRPGAAWSIRHGPRLGLAPALGRGVGL